MSKRSAGYDNSRACGAPPGVSRPGRPSGAPSLPEGADVSHPNADRGRVSTPERPLAMPMLSPRVARAVRMPMGHAPHHSLRAARPPAAVFLAPEVAAAQALQTEEAW